MAAKRMFAKTIVDSDAFLDMPLSTQALYFHLSMRADDDGFVNNPKKIQRMIGASDDDCRILISKRFILLFEKGVIVIKHWRLHNTLRKDRYKQTIYQDEFNSLKIKDDGSYTEKGDDDWLPTGCQTTPQMLPVGCQDGNQPATQNRLDKNRLDKNHNKQQTEIRYGEDSGPSSVCYENSLKENIDAAMDTAVDESAFEDDDSILNVVGVIRLCSYNRLKVNRSERLVETVKTGLVSVGMVKECLDITKRSNGSGAYFVGCLANAINDPDRYKTTKQQIRDAERKEREHERFMSEHGDDVF